MKNHGPKVNEFLYGVRRLRAKKCHYINFLEQISAKTLLNLAEKIVDDEWILSNQELEKIIDPSSALHSLKIRFWREASHTWLGEKKFSLSDVLNAEGRTYQYWRIIFIGNPKILVWLLNPLSDLLQLSPMVRGIGLKLHEIFSHPIARETGTIKISDAKIILKLTEIITKASDGGSPLHDLYCECLCIVMRVMRARLI